MSIGIAVVCRYNSSRLNGKILQKFGNQTVLEIIHNRLRKNFLNIPIVIATSSEKSDDIICDFCHKNDFDFLRGSLNDVAKRLIDCSNHFNWDYFVRINGDNVFVDVESLKEMIQISLDQSKNFVTNVPSRTFPYGMSVEILKTKFYEDIYYNKISSDEHKEHVTKWLYDNLNEEQYHEYKNYKYSFIKGKKIALDTHEDSLLIQRIINFSDGSINSISLDTINTFFRDIRNK